MKTLIHKTWFRRLCQMALVVVSLGALAWAAFNWRGARLKRDAVARMEAGGWPSDLSDVLGNMPPDSSNYAMIPLLRDARLETLEAARRGIGRPVPHSARASIEALYENDFAKTKPRAGEPNPGQPDFSRLPAGSPYGNTAESFLREYDRRNGETLRELVAGLSLPETRQPVGAERGADWFRLNEAFGIGMRKVTDGLCLRAYAAIVTGDSAKAAESIVVVLRLSEVIGSRNFPISHAIQRVMVAAAAGRVKQGMERHVWTAADLQRIRAGFEGIRMRERLKGCQAFSARVWVDSWSRWETDRKDFGEVFSFLEMDHEGIEDLGAVLPAGWFDMNAAAHADRWLDLEKFIDSTPTMAPWCIRAREMKEESMNHSFLSKLFFPSGDSVEASSFLQWVADVEVVRHQTMLACDLDLHRLKSGSYPATLADLPSPAHTDPLHGSDFIYRREGDFFVLYSTGPDGKDDGAVKQKRKSSWDQPDWVW